MCYFYDTEVLYILKWLKKYFVAFLPFHEKRTKQSGILRIFADKKVQDLNLKWYMWNRNTELKYFKNTRERTNLHSLKSFMIIRIDPNQ